MTPDRIKYVVITGKLQILIVTEGGAAFLVGRGFTPRLSGASDRVLRDYQVIGQGTGIRWPQVDEDLALDHIIAQASREHWPGRNDCRIHPSADVSFASASNAEASRYVHQLKLVRDE